MSSCMAAQPLGAAPAVRGRRAAAAPASFVPRASAALSRCATAVRRSRAPGCARASAVSSAASAAAIDQRRGDDQRGIGMMADGVRALPAGNIEVRQQARSVRADRKRSGREWCGASECAGRPSELTALKRCVPHPVSRWKRGLEPFVRHISPPKRTELEQLRVPTSGPASSPERKRRKVSLTPWRKSP